MTEILSDEAVAELEKRIDSFPLSPIQARALCATVKHLRARERELEKLAYLGEHHHPDQTWKARALEHHEQAKQLQSKLEQLRAENERLQNDALKLSKALADELKRQ